jgi:hypothetical protein
MFLRTEFHQNPYMHVDCLRAGMEKLTRVQTMKLVEMETNYISMSVLAKLLIVSKITCSLFCSVLLRSFIRSHSGRY